MLKDTERMMHDRGKKVSFSCIFVIRARRALIARLEIFWLRGKEIACGAKETLLRIIWLQCG